MTQYIWHQCQVCGFKGEITTPEGYDDWTHHVINFKDGSLQIVACPKCFGLNIDQVLENYKRRILDGFDARYH